MFCYQCEQTSKGTGCTDFAVCGKDENSAILQDLLVHAAKGIAQYNHRARPLGAKDRAVDRFILEALFTTVTNVNFDAAGHRAGDARSAPRVRDQAKALYETAARKAGKPPETLNGPGHLDAGRRLWPAWSTRARWFRCCRAATSSGRTSRACRNC